jgi:hypothetical protein
VTDPVGTQAAAVLPSDADTAADYRCGRRTTRNGT